MTALRTDTAVVLSIAVASAGALGLALVSQYGFDLWPCLLCYYQRAPYGAALVLALLALMPAVDAPSRRLIVGLCAVLFALNAGIAFYHVGVEEKWWLGPAECIGQAQDFSPDDLLAAVNQAGRTGCEEAAFRFIGISMAGYNVIACALLAAFYAWAVARKDWWSAKP
ncbi:MAG: disulfide bond formation protein B [Rhodospirillaceae bacterium]|nr:disulfide bond formation protein B [Rhodospirillaceae bacterium]